MKKLITAIFSLCCMAGMVSIAWAENPGSALSDDRLQTLQTICKLSDYEEYNVYSMEILYDYTLENLMPDGEADTQKILDLASQEAAPGYHFSFTAPDFGCSALTLSDSDGTVRFGRNYDFRYDTSCMIVRCHPKDGYASVAHAALNNLQADDPDSSEEARTACLLTPFVCLDGINEKGVGIAALTVDAEPVKQDTGKPVLAASILIRLVLDQAASTEEAVCMLENYDIVAMSGLDCHFYITDSCGDSRIVEFDPDSETRQMVATPTRTATNFYIMYADKVEPNQKNGVYGHGKERWMAIEDVITANGGTGDGAVAWQALKSAAQERNSENITSNTQWSVIYNLNSLSYELIFHRNWDKVYTVTLEP